MFTAALFGSTCWRGFCQLPRSPVQLTPSTRPLRCRHILCCASSTSEQTIAERIRLSQLRKSQKLSERLGCPGCMQKNLAPRSLLNHMNTCCPDIIHNQNAWDEALTKPIQLDRVRSLLKEAEAIERRLQRTVLDLSFRQVDAEGESIRLTPSEVAAKLHLAVDRCERLLRYGIKATPMPGDSEPVEVLWEDDWLIAVNKPAHLNTTPMHRHVGNSMVNRLITYLGDVPKVVQRLDHDTSGVLVFAKDSETSSRMHTLFREKRVQKIYVAICMGVPRTADSGGFSEYIVGSLRPGDEQMVVTAPVDRHPHIGPAACLNASGKPAQTIVTLLDSCEEPTWDGEHGDSWFQSKPHTMQGACVVQCKPLTGKTHQIRLHLAAAGLPIVGDSMYGLKHPQSQRQCLHAASLTFQHPVKQHEVRIVAPLPHDMQHVLSSCQLEIGSL